MKFSKQDKKDYIDFLYDNIRSGKLEQSEIYENLANINNLEKTK